MSMQNTLNSLAKIVHQAGVLGAGGGGFPLFKKLTQKRNTLIINAGESEPLTCKDKEILTAYPECVITGALTIAEQVHAHEIIIGYRELSLDAAQKLRHLAKAHHIKVIQVPNLYPIGYEKNLVSWLLNKPFERSKSEVLVCNVETARNVAWATLNKNVRDKVLTISGAVERPVTLNAPIGASFYECLQAAGGATCDRYVVFDGGLLSGSQTQPDDIFVTAVTKGFIVLPHDHSFVKKPESSQEKALYQNCQKWFFGSNCAILKGNQLPMSTVYSMLDIKNYQTEIEPIEKLPFPSWVRIGAPYKAPIKPIVSKGFIVKRGEIIATITAQNDLPIHSSIDGEVTHCCETYIDVKHLPKK